MLIVFRITLRKCLVGLVKCEFGFILHMQLNKSMLQLVNALREIVVCFLNESNAENFFDSRLNMKGDDWEEGSMRKVRRFFS